MLVALPLVIREPSMKLNPLDHVQIHIQKSTAAGDCHVDANKVATAVQRFFPTFDLQMLIDIVVSEVILSRGAVSWENSGMHDAQPTDLHHVHEPGLTAGVAALRNQENRLAL